jgi:hypothetical protein
MRESFSQSGKFNVIIDLNTEMVDALMLVTAGDREIHPRILEHPFRIISFQDRRLDTEESRIESDGVVQISNAEGHVEALHESHLLVRK